MEMEVLSAVDPMRRLPASPHGASASAAVAPSLSPSPRNGWPSARDVTRKPSGSTVSRKFSNLTRRVMRKLRNISNDDGKSGPQKYNTGRRMSVTEGGTVAIAQSLLDIKTVLDTTHAEYRLKPKHCFFMPDSKPRQYWDAGLLLCLLYVGVVVPFSEAFDASAAPLSGRFWFEALIDLFFVIDVLINFRTGFMEHTTAEVVIDLRKIAIRYMRTWFIIDVVSCAPIGYIQLIYKEDDMETNNGDLKVMKVLRFLRFGKMLRLARIGRLLERLEDTNISDALMGLKTAGVVIIMLWFSHLLCCVWYVCGTGSQVNHGATEPIDGWALNPEYKLVNTTIFTYYLLAFHGVNPKLAPVGDGVATGRTNFELVYSILAELMSVVIFGVLTGLMSSWIGQGKVSSQLYTQRMESLTEFLRAKHFPYVVRKKVRYFYAHLYANKTVFDEQQILDHLPPGMASDLVYHMYADVINGTPFFKQLSNEVVTKLCLAMHPYPALPGDVIMKEDAVGNEMYIIKDGQVAISQGGTVLGVLEKGGFFGEMAVIQHGERCLRNRTATALKHADLCFLTNDSVFLLCDIYPELGINLDNFVANRRTNVLWNDAEETSAPPGCGTAALSDRAPSSCKGILRGTRPIASPETMSTIGTSDSSTPSQVAVHRDRDRNALDLSPMGIVRRSAKRNADRASGKEVTAETAEAPTTESQQPPASAAMKLETPGLAKRWNRLASNGRYSVPDRMSSKALMASSSVNQKRMNARMDSFEISLGEVVSKLDTMYTLLSEIAESTRGAESFGARNSFRSATRDSSVEHMDKDAVKRTAMRSMGFIARTKSASKF